MRLSRYTLTTLLPAPEVKVVEVGKVSAALEKAPYGRLLFFADCLPLYWLRRLYKRFLPVAYSGFGRDMK